MPLVAQTEQHSAQSRFDFQISAGAASSALTELGSQSGTTILIKHEATDASLPVLRGNYSLVEGLERILKNSGLEYEFVDDAVIISKSPRSLLSTLSRAFSKAFSSSDNNNANVNKKNSLEEIVVTSRKRSELLQDTPISITVFSSEVLAQRSISTLNQISEGAPNLVFDNATPFSPSNASSIIIRGIGIKDFTLVSEPGVGLYIDDVYIPHSVGNVSDVVDIERIEVLRGPQGTLFGRNTIGGAVRVVTQKPDDQFAGKLQFNAGSYDRMGVKANINVPVTDKFFLRLSGLKQQWDGFVKTPNLDGDNDLGDKDVTTIIGAARWVPDNRFTADLNMAYSRDGAGRVPSVLVSALPADRATGFGVNDAAIAAALPEAPAPEVLFNDQYVATSNIDLGNEDLGSSLELFSVGLTLDWALTDRLNFKSISSYRDVESEFYTDLDHSPLRVIQTDDHLLTNSYSQEVQLYGDSFNDRLNWTIGAYYFEEDGVYDDQVIFGRAFEVFSGGKVKSKSIATFGQATYDIYDNLSLTAGLRWSDDSKDWIVDADHQFFIPTRLTEQGSPIGLPDDSIQRNRLVPIGTQRISATSTDPYLNLAYRWNDSWLTYLSYSEGFKGGGFQERNAPGSFTDGSYDAEFASVYELGSKWISPNRRYTFNGSVFYTDYTNLQLNVVNRLVREIRNAGEAEISGFELEFSALPTDAITITAGVGYLDAKYTEISPQAIASGIDLNNDLPGVPEWQANLDMSYIINTSFGRFVPQFVASHSTEQFNDATNNPRYSRDRYTLVDVSLAFIHSSERWSASITGKNVTDEQFFLAGFEDSTLEYTDAVLSRPREWIFNLAYNF